MTARFTFDVDAAAARIQAAARRRARGLSQESQESQGAPMAALSVDQLDEDERAAFEERAAIIEFEGGEPRAQAARRAFEEVIGARNGT